MKNVPIKVYSKKELRGLYGISRETFNKWLRPIKENLPNYQPTSKLLTPAQVKVIFEHLGEPEIEDNKRKTSVKHV